MKFLIAGLGSIGRRHLRNLITLGYEDVILYRTGKSTLPDDELERFPTEYSLEEALAHGPDAVIVSNPTSLHLDVAIPAAKAGCHLLIEKPISHSMEGVRELQEAVAEGAAKVLVGFQFRFHPGLQAVKAWLESEEIGAPVTAQSWWGEYLPDWHPWEDFRHTYAARKDLGGGVVLTLCHSFDYLRWLFGEVAWISASIDQCGSWELPVEDIADVFLRFSSGVRGLVHLDYIQRPPEHTLKIIGSEGMIQWEHSEGKAHLYRIGTDEWITSVPPRGFKRNDLFLGEMKHFIELTQGKVDSFCSLEDGIAVMDIVEGIKASSETGQGHKRI